MLKICLTGGPCSGKTTALKHLIDLVESKGYACLVCEEVATTLINGGIKPFKYGLSMEDFQRFVLEKQITAEELIDKAPYYLNTDKIVVFYDRGFCDQEAYVGKEFLNKLLSETSLKDADLYSRYDYVLYLMSAAKGATNFYEWNDPDKEETGNNAARYEPPEVAAELDDKIYNAWKEHPHFIEFDNSTDFETKIQRVLNAVNEIIENSQQD